MRGSAAVKKAEYKALTCKCAPVQMCKSAPKYMWDAGKAVAQFAAQVSCGVQGKQ